MRLLDLRRGVVLTGALLLLFSGAEPAAAQTALQRSPLLAGGTVGLPWTLTVDPAFRFARDGGMAGVRQWTSFDAHLGLPAWTLAGARYAPQSAVAHGSPGEWEVYGRWAALAEARGAPLDVLLQLGFNGAATSADAELTVARWLGPLRLAGAGRVLGNAFGGGETGLAVAGGVVLFPHPRGVPVSLAADAATRVDRPAGSGERAAWSVAVNVGIPYSTHTLSLFATNTRSGSLHGVTAGDGRVRAGLGFTVPIEVGRILGTVASREQGQRSVRPDVAATPAAVQTEIFRYAYPASRLTVERGTTIEWTNRDAVVHTVSADDGSWASGAIPAGEIWRARFDEPGIFTFHCGPHPYMKAVVIVR